MKQKKSQMHCFNGLKSTDEPFFKGSMRMRKPDYTTIDSDISILMSVDIFQKIQLG
jgi:hypothetical protein